jgi:16S rRNA (guanine(527)-N(7))-methyltransferase RsmG
MFHVKHPGLADVADWAGLDVPDGMAERLDGLAQWLATEGVEAGGLGPHEGSRVWERHILDSLMFARGWDVAPDTIVDVGTGIGLPGLPLAVALPDRSFALVDRSGRRIRLIRRAVRQFGLENVEAIESEAEAFFAARGPADAVVMRGVLQPASLPAFVGRAVAVGGVLVAGAGLDPDPVPGSDLVRFPGSEVLAPGRWLRIMRRT